MAGMLTTMAGMLTTMAGMQGPPLACSLHRSAPLPPHALPMRCPVLTYRSAYGLCGTELAAPLHVDLASRRCQSLEVSLSATYLPTPPLCPMPYRPTLPLRPIDHPSLYAAAMPQSKTNAHHTHTHTQTPCNLYQRSASRYWSGAYEPTPPLGAVRY
eukprot:918477-Rhodomonas_salina.2